MKKNKIVLKSNKPQPIQLVSELSEEARRLYDSMISYGSNLEQNAVDESKVREIFNNNDVCPEYVEQIIFEKRGYLNDAMINMALSSFNTAETIIFTELINFLEECFNAVKDDIIIPTKNNEGFNPYDCFVTNVLNVFTIKCRDLVGKSSQTPLMKDLIRSVSTRVWLHRIEGDPDGFIKEALYGNGGFLASYKAWLYHQLIKIWDECWIMNNGLLKDIDRINIPQFYAAVIGAINAGIADISLLIKPVIDQVIELCSSMHNIGFIDYMDEINETLKNQAKENVTVTHF